MDAVQRSLAKTLLVALTLIAGSACGAPDTPATSRWIGFARAAEAQAVAQPDAPPPSEPELTTEQRLASEVWRRIDAARRDALECTPEMTTVDGITPRANVVLADVCRRDAARYGGGTRRPLVARVTDDARDGFLLVSDRQPTPEDPRATARIELRSCVDGAVIAAAAPSSCFDVGVAFAAGRDIDGDGVGDFAIGHSNGMGCERGCVEVFSGVDLRTLRVIDEPAPGGYIEGFGASVAFVRDLDGDGAAEILVGCEEDIDSGDGYYVAVFSGRTGKLLDGSLTSGRFVRVAALDQDVDGDGKDEFLLHHPENGDAWIVRGGDVGAKREQAGWQPLFLLNSRDSEPASVPNVRSPPAR